VCIILDINSICNPTLTNRALNFLFLFFYILNSSDFYNYRFYKMRLISALVLFIVSIIACNKPQSFEYRGMQNLKVDSIGLVSSKITLELVYFNPNNFGVDLRNVSCDVYINHNYLGKYNLDTLMHIAKRSEFLIASSMQVD